MNTEIISLETTFKTVFVGSRTDMFGETVPDGGLANENALSPKLILVLGAM